jgi:hypothetical protein
MQFLEYKIDDDSQQNIFWRYEVPASAKKAVYRIQPDGIYLIKIVDDHIVETPIWQWKNFEITEVLEIHRGNEIEYTYAGIYNDHEFSDLTIEKIKNMMAPESLFYSKDKQIFGPLVKKYVDGEHIPVFEVEKLIGFTKNGWRMPDKYRVDTIKNSNHAKIIQTMRESLSQPCPSKDVVCKWIHDLHLNMTLDDKDILFAYACIQPFMYCLKQYLSFMPLIGLGSTEGETGKSTGMAALTTKWWNNCKGKEVLTKDNMDSKARALEYMSTSTFMLIIDDAGKLDDAIQSEIKSYTTMESNFERKNKDGGLATDKPLSDPLGFTWNNKPNLFNLIEVLTRCLFVLITHKPTPQEAAIFTALINIIPNGAIGLYIYRTTEKLQGDELYQKYMDCKDSSEIIQTRHQILWKYLQLGQQFAKEWFDLDLDISEGPRLLNETMLLGNEELFNVIQNQIQIGIDPDSWVDIVDKEGDVIRKDWRPMEKWITHPILEYQYKGQEGYLFDSSNKIDLFNRIKMDQSLGVDYLHTILKIRWPSIIYTQIKYKGQNARRIFIPKVCLDGDDKKSPFLITSDDVKNIAVNKKKEEVSIESIGKFKGFD